MERQGLRLTALMVCVATLVGVNGPCVHAQDAEPGLTLVPGASCLTTAPLRDRIEQWLGSPLPSPGAPASLKVTGSDADPRSVTVEVHVRGELRASRSFAPGPPGCEDLLDSVAIASAMMLQTLPPEAWMPEPPALEPPAVPPALPPSPSEPTGDPQPTTPPPRAPPTPPDDRPPDTRAVTLGAVGLVWPARGGSGVGAGLDVGVELGKHADLRVGGFGMAAPSRPLNEGQGSYASYTWGGNLQGCAGQDARTYLRLRACLGLRVGQVGARADAVSREALASVDLGLEAQLRLGRRWRLALGLGVGFRSRPVSVSRYDEDGDPVGAAELPRLGALLSVGVRRILFAKPASFWGMKEQ